VKPILERFIKHTKYSSAPLVQTQIDLYFVYLRDTLRHAPGYIQQQLRHLRVWYGKTEPGHELDFNLLRGQQRVLRKHTAYTEQEIHRLFELLAGNLLANALVHVLYDMAGRAEDALHLRWENIQDLGKDGGEAYIPPGKAAEGFCDLTQETMGLLKLLNKEN
jgi:integrase